MPGRRLVRCLRGVVVGMSDDSLRDFLSTVEKSAKRILREHGKKKILEANREKADAARRRAWEDSLAPGPSGSMSLEGTVRPDTMALMLGTTAVSMAATSHGLPPLGRTSSLAGATMGDTAASAPPAFPTLSDKLRSKSAMHKTQKSLRSTTRALEDLTKSPLATGL